MTEGARFTGRHVLITGSTGMAASAARAVAAEGGVVFLVSRTAAHLEALGGEILASGGRCAWHTADLRHEAEVEAAFAAFDRTGGRLGAAYSVAGISGRPFGDGPIHDATLEGWDTVLAANATSQFLVLQRRLLTHPPHEAMVTSREGRRRFRSCLGGPEEESPACPRPISRHCCRRWSAITPGSRGSSGARRAVPGAAAI
jgi:NAD(P)-dependent dehydrogenase (short-subunit alcohol dehydrogenase family)